MSSPRRQITTTCHACTDKVDRSAAVEAKDRTRTKGAAWDAAPVVVRTCSQECAALVEDCAALCPLCREQFDRPSAKGRPRTYCSDVCTSAAMHLKAADRLLREQGLPTYAELLAERDDLAVRVERAERHERENVDWAKDAEVRARDLRDAVETLTEQHTAMTETIETQAQEANAMSDRIAEHEAALAAERILREDAEARAVAAEASALAATAKVEGLEAAAEADTRAVEALSFQVARLATDRDRYRDLHHALLDEAYPVSADVPAPSEPAPPRPSRAFADLVADDGPPAQTVLRIVGD